LNCLRPNQIPGFEPNIHQKARYVNILNADPRPTSIRFVYTSETRRYFGAPTCNTSAADDIARNFTKRFPNYNTPAIFNSIPVRYIAPGRCPPNVYEKWNHRRPCVHAAFGRERCDNSARVADLILLILSSKTNPIQYSHSVHVHSSIASIDSATGF
jgi:hypothetical protein